MFIDTKGWETAEETENDKELKHLLSFGWNKEEIMNEFCKRDSKPKFSKMLFVNEDLCKMIVEDWERCEKIQESDEANYKSSHY